MTMKVEVVYVNTCDRSFLMSLDATDSMSVRTAIERSGVLQQFPEIDLTKYTVGVFSKKVRLDRLVLEGDRIEIYRPLTIDPKQARLLRVKK